MSLMDHSLSTLLAKGFRLDIRTCRIERGLNRPELVTQLYPHQVDGIKWMDTRHQIGSGFILADDMGLGKTIQIIGHIIKDEEGRRTLIVVPKSILEQWHKEIMRHTTYNEEDIYIYYQNNRKVPESARIVLTTSQTLVHDKTTKDCLYSQEWYRVVIDESSGIRNKTTQFSKCVTRLKYKHGICISGTPINNDIKDIYPQLDFARIPKPSFMEGRRDNWLEIARICNQSQLEEWRSNYLLRRTKSILKLPPVQVKNIPLIMTKEEFEVYSATLRDAHFNFMNWNTTRDKSIETYTKVLYMVLRMRQSCNHPNLSAMNLLHGKNEGCCLYCGNSHEEMKNHNCCEKHVICNNCISKKTETCIFCKMDPMNTGNSTSTKITELFKIRSQIPSSEKMVVFSQWTSMLDVIGNRADELGVQYARLDGSMCMSERERQQELFKRSPDCNMFLVSLKAGGMGLNLTQANHVILMDPWWNPFVEQQAIDRIYRIGQKRNIYVYKLYMSFTIEEWMNNLKMIKLEKSNIAIGKCDFTMGISGSLGQKEIDGLFQYVNTYVEELARRVK